MEKSEITKQLLETQLNEFVKIVYGEENNFEFRPRQKEAILDLIYNTLVENRVNQIIEAPTGTGKSIINLISATFLAHYYKKSSYILCSDLYLFSQYENSIIENEYFDEHIAYIKGQYGNYKCWVNGEDFRSGICRVAQTPWSLILKPFTKEFKNRESECEYPCALKCEYCKQKVKIRDAKVVVTTYQNLLFCYLYHDLDKYTGENRAENLKNAKITMPYNLRPKTYCFCDEAHNIPQIVQAHFTPKIKLSDYQNHENLYNYAKYNNIGIPEINWAISHPEMYVDVSQKFENSNKLYSEFSHYYDIISKKSIKHTELLGILNKFRDNYYDVLKMMELCIRNKIGVKLINKEKLTPEEYAILSECNIYAEFYCKFSDVMNALNVVGGKYILKEYLEDENGEEIIELHCMKEDYLCSHYFLNFHRHRIFTSATIGDKSQFDKNLGIPKSGFFASEIIKIPSSFDFSKSPISFLNKYSMAYRFKNDSIVSLAYYIDKICLNKYSNSRGIIQTGSYANMREFLELCDPEVSKRFMFYNNSREKKEIIDKFKKSKNGILIGPSLTQGIDLPGDLCRFIIIAKIPFMNINDNFVKEKIKLFPKWYDSQASIEIIQGIGRGVRFNGDFCETYILDKCFGNLYFRTKSQYPDEIKNRIKYYKFGSDLYENKKEVA